MELAVTTWAYKYLNYASILLFYIHSLRQKIDNLDRFG